jgi:hypothetical protein
MHTPTVEPLEARIVLSGLVIVNPHTATYTDSDGDHVTVKVSAGTLTDAAFTFTPAGALAELELGPSFYGADVTFSVVRAPHGDGLANVGLIDAPGVNLGNVTVAGDLGRIIASSSSGTVPAVQSLDVYSMGRIGTDSQEGVVNPSLESQITGTLGALKITADDSGTYILVTGGDIGSIKIGGSLIGGSAENSGEIAVSGSGDIGPIKIGHDILGGTGQQSGSIVGEGTIGTVTIGGSIIGGSGAESGEILGGSIGLVHIAGNLQGGDNGGSGVVLAESINGTLAGITIGGSLIGGPDGATGGIESDGTIGVIHIGHDDLGGLITADGIASITVGGSVIGDSFNGSGQISSGGSIGPVTIGRDVIGSGAGPAGIGAASSVASVTVGGSVYSGAIGGSQVGPVSIHGNLQGTVFSRVGPIGNVTIGGSLAAGVGDGAGSIASETTLGEVKIGGEDQGGDIGAGGNIAGVTVGGSLTGGPSSDSGVIDTTAGNIGPVKIGGDFTGGSAEGTGTLGSSGLIESAGSITSVRIGGSIISGEDTSSSGPLTDDASIRAGAVIGSLAVGGSIVGNPDGGMASAASPVIISAVGPATPIAPSDLAIGSITVGGRVEDAVILAGYGSARLGAVNGSAQIGPVKVGADWIASDLVAGAANGDTPAEDPFPNFGNVDDNVSSGATTGIHSSIASIVIRGQVIGTPASVNSADNFGFVADSIGSMTVGSFAITIPTNTTPLEIGPTGDVDVHIIAA